MEQKPGWNMEQGRNQHMTRQHERQPETTIMIMISITIIMIIIIINYQLS